MSNLSKPPRVREYREWRLDDEHHLKSTQLVTLYKNTRGNISCLHAVGNLLYVGTSLGMIRLFTVKMETQVTGVEYTHELKAEFETKQHSPIEEIQTDNVFRIAFVRTNHKLFVLNMDDLQPFKFGEEEQTEINDVTLFALDKYYTSRKISNEEQEYHRIAIYSKRKINFYEYNPTTKIRIDQPVQSSETPLEISYLLLVNGYVIFAVDSFQNQNYTLVKLKKSRDEGTDETIIPSSWYLMEDRGVKPQIIHFDKFIGLIKYGSIVMPSLLNGADYYDIKNPGTRFGSIQFTSPNFNNAQIAMSFPFVAALQNNEIEICSLFDGRDVKNKYASTRSRRIPAKGYKMICGSLEYLYVANDKTISIVTLPTIDEQVALLTQDLLTSHSNYLLQVRYRDDNSNKTKSKFVAMNEAAGFSNLFAAKFSEAFEKFKKARDSSDIQTRMDVREILVYFLRNIKMTTSQIRSKEKQLGDPSKRPHYLLDEEFFSTYEIKYKGYKPTDNLRVKLEEYLTKKAREATIKGKMKGEKIEMKGVEELRNNQLDLLSMKAENYLLEFLESIRKPNCAPEEVPEQTVIDFALIVLYMKRLKHRPDAHRKLHELVKGKNNCLVPPQSDVFVNELRKERECYKYVALLLESKKQHRAALRTLKAHVKADGIDETVEILSNISDWSLIKDYADWVMELDPEKSIKIFTTYRGDKCPKPDDVLHFLSAYPKHITQEYLKYLINVEKNNEEQYHTLYASILIENILKIKPKDSNKLLPGVRLRAGQEQGLLGEFRTDLLNHLQNGNYNVDETIDKLKKTNDLFEELAEAYTRQGRYEEALETLLNKLQDKNEAIAYCDRVYQNILKKDPNEIYDFNPLFPIFLDICFCKGDKELQKPHQIDWAIELLNTRASEIDIVAALKVLPDNIPIKKISKFLTQGVQLTHHQYRSATVLAHISETAHIEIKKRHKTATTRHIIVDPQTTCDVSGQPIGDAVFAVFPNKSKVLYRNLLNGPNNTKYLHIHPKTKHNFKKLPVTIE